MKIHKDVGSEPIVPTDLRKALDANPHAKHQWNDLTPIGRRDFILWIDSAKQPETRRRRIESIPSRLASGKRRPCCFAVIPMDLYQALPTDPKAKAQWKTLTPDEKRDFVHWIDSAKTERKQRIENVISMLAKGKRKP